MKKFSVRNALINFFTLFLTACSTVPSHEIFGDKFDLPSRKKAPEVIFIHGMFVNSKCWEAWLKRFKDAGFIASAPAWPLHEGPMQELRGIASSSERAKLELKDVLESYRRIIKTKVQKPILVGHSMGGLVAQILLTEGLADSAIVIHSAPPHGVFGLSWSALRSNWGILNPFASDDQVVEKDLDAFKQSWWWPRSPVT